MTKIRCGDCELLRAAGRHDQDMRGGREACVVFISYYSQIKPSCSITDRQVTLRSLTTFFFIASRWETMGDFIPQTPSLGTSPQTPSSLRAYSSPLSEKSIRTSEATANSALNKSTFVIRHHLLPAFVKRKTGSHRARSPWLHDQYTTAPAPCTNAGAAFMSAFPPARGKSRWESRTRTRSPARWR